MWFVFPSRLAVIQFQEAGETVGSDEYFVTRTYHDDLGRVIKEVYPNDGNFTAVTEYDAGENHTIEPTYTAAAIVLMIPLNQRATFRWVAAPGSELVAPATAANGFGIQTTTSSAVAITGTLLLEES